MKGLADIALAYFCTILFSGDENIDSDFAAREMEQFPELIRDLTAAERTALADAAKRTLDAVDQPPDQYGYKPRVSQEYRDFLDSLASGEIFTAWN
jgi:hypothetical protein